MAQLIKHRVNTIDDLAGIDPTWGVEIDLRSDLGQAGRIHLSHDPWIQGDLLEDWLSEFCARGIRGPLILNTKEDGLEAPLLEAMKKHRIERFFFLDTAIPTLMRHAVFGKERRFAVRLSSIEPVEFVRPLIKHVDWIWLDCFKGELFLPFELQELRKHAKVCLVSPELQNAPEAIERFITLSAQVDAVCTKVPERYLPRI